MTRSVLSKLAPSRRSRLRRLFRRTWLGAFWRTTPLSNRWGYDRGTPVDRYYIEKFLEIHRRDIRGDVLEVKDSTYTKRFGTAVEQNHVLDVDPANPRATVLADLAAADPIATNSFDCFLLTQTLQFIYDVRAAIAHAHRILRPDGILLVTVPSVSRITPRTEAEHDYWRFTSASCQLLFEEVFGVGQVTVYSYGNVLAGVAFLLGMAYEELSRRELEVQDDYFPVIIAVRAVKMAAAVSQEGQ